MSRRSEMQAAVRQAGAQSERVDAVGALRDAGFTGLIAFGVLLPLIGFLTGVDGSNQLILTTRWPLLFAVVAIVAACRFLYSFALVPWLARRAHRPVPADRPANFWLKLRGALAKWFIPSAIGFFVTYPLIIYFTIGTSGGQKWIDNFGIQILIYV